MVYDPATDFLGLWRASGGEVSKLEMPGLDYVLAALARAGVINLTVSATAPVANQSTTAWLQAAVPSYSAEGAFFLWDKVTTAYLAATPALFLQFLEASAQQSGISWHATTGGAPLNTVGTDGDFAIRTDGVGGIYGPKVAGAWPATPLPGTTNEINQDALDTTFGADPGNLIVRGAADWAPLLVGGAGEVLNVVAGLPAWAALSDVMDSVFGNAQGSILYRGVANWSDLGPGVADQVLASGGPAADPAWAPRAAEFPSGTRMLFNQTAAPTGWTKELLLDDYGLRVTAGAVGATAGSAFSTVFAQAVTGDHVLTVAEIPPHTHPAERGNGQVPQSGGGATGGLVNLATGVTDATGGGVAHSHPVNLTLAYVDVIIATKD